MDSPSQGPGRRAFENSTILCGRTASFCGRCMYHCHILQHEDHDMMRPVVVMLAELMPFMDMHARHGKMSVGP